MQKSTFLSPISISALLCLCCLLQTTELRAQTPAEPKLDLDFNIAAKTDQIMYDAAECLDGCLIAVGQTQSTRGSGQDAWLVKIDKKGKTVFRKSFGTNNMDDCATAVAELPSGLIISAGISTPKAEDNKEDIKAWLRCRDTKGDKVWDRELSQHTFSLQIEDLLVDHAHNRLILIGVRGEQLWLVMTDYTGAKVIDIMIKDKQLDNLSIRSAKLLMRDGSLYIFGMAGLGPEKRSPYLVKLDANGRKLQQPAIFVDENVVQTGLIGSIDSERLLLPCSKRQNKVLADLALIRVDTALDKSRATVYDLKGPRDDVAVEVQAVAPGRYYLFGNTTSHSSGAIKHDFFLAALDSEGQFDEREPFYPSPHKLEDHAVRFLKTTEGTLWLCGTRTYGSDFYTQTDFWFGRLEQKAVTDDNISLEPLQPLIVEAQNQAGALELLPGENTSYALTLRNPNKRPTGTLTIRSKTPGLLRGLVLTPEIMLPEIPAGATVRIDIPLRVDLDAGSGQTDIAIAVSNAHGDQLGGTAFPVRIKALSIEVAEYNIKGKAVKGQPCTLRAVFENRGTMAGKDLSLFWAAPAGVTFSGNYQQTIPALATGERFETTVTVIPSENFNGAQMEMKAYWTLAESDYNVSFPLKFNLSEPEPVANIPSTLPPGQPNSLVLIVQWRGDVPEKNTSFEQVYEIKATATSSRELSIEHFKIVLNGDTISYSGQKFDEKPLTRPRKNGQYYTVDFSKKIELQPGPNTVEVIVMNEAGIAQTDIPWLVDYKPNDKRTLYVVSVGIPDKSGQIKYSEQDARDFAHLMQAQQGHYYGTVELVTLTGYDSTEAKNITIKVNSLVRENERKTFGNLDAVVLFVSGHGYIDENDGTFRIQGSDYDVNAQEQTTVNFDKIVAELDKLSCNKFVLVDACQGASGDLAMLGRKGSADDFDYSAALDKVLNSSKKVRSMASCSKGEFSYEDASWENGAFTHVLKQTLGDRPTCVALDKDGDKALSMKELFPFVQTEVLKSVKSVKKGKTQTPSMPAAQLNDDVPFFFY